jgi:hypothetical protein
VSYLYAAIVGWLPTKPDPPVNSLMSVEENREGEGQPFTTRQLDDTAAHLSDDS